MRIPVALHPHQHLMWAWSVAQLCRTLCDPMDCSLPGSSVHGISQARIHFPCPSQGDLPDPGRSPVAPGLVGGFFTTEPPRKTHQYLILSLKNFFESFWWLHNGISIVVIIFIFLMTSNVEHFFVYIFVICILFCHLGGVIFGILCISSMPVLCDIYALQLFSTRLWLVYYFFFYCLLLFYNDVFLKNLNLKFWWSQIF